MRYTFRRSFTQLLTAGCIVALTTSIPAASLTVQEELDDLLARYDLEPDGPAKESLALRIDATAHQKYATVSRLYWHTDLASAKAAAREQGRPILHLRMLGSLEEDLSCANSRLFRTTLYANQELSAFLRQRFVLYWSSERPVPRVTIDYGDGRILERTTAGNSAHYVLDEHGNVLDVLPGLYAPLAFRHELEGSLALAERVRDKSDNERARSIVEYHEQLMSAAERSWERMRPPTAIRAAQPLAAAQRATLTKAAIEVRDLRLFAKEVAPEEVPDDQVETWAAIGRALYWFDGLRQPAPPARAIRSQVPVLDDASRALVIRLHNAGPSEMRASNEGIRALIARLEQTIVGDTALNQLRLRPEISREIVRMGGRFDFPALNNWIYARVFRTPREDVWLGLLQRDVFTGLPADGVVFRGTR